MKALILSLVVAGLATVANISDISAKGGYELYKNVEADPANNSKTITVYKGKSEANLVPEVRYEMRYNQDGSPVEKVIYTWNAENSKWEASKKYEYAYNDYSKKPEILSYMKWNKTTDTWDDTNAYYAIYLYNTEGTTLLTDNDF